MMLPFVKLQGAGNDFILLDQVAGAAAHAPLDAALAQRLCDRRFGIGADQILLLHDGDQQRFGYRILNADGSEAGQCGNGARCIALYLRRRYRLPARFVLESPAGPVQVDASDPAWPEVCLGVPDTRPEAVPTRRSEGEAGWLLQHGDLQLPALALSLGNPHVVLQVADCDAAPLAALAAALTASGDFPQGCNVGAAQRLSPQAIRLRVLERGAGETLACGSGACAAVVALRLRGLLQEQVQVQLPGGQLQVRWRGSGEAVYLAGPASWVHAGSFQT